MKIVCFVAALLWLSACKNNSSADKSNSVTLDSFYTDSEFFVSGNDIVAPDGILLDSRSLWEHQPHKLFVTWPHLKDEADSLNYFLRRDFIQYTNEIRTSDSAVTHITSAFLYMDTAVFSYCFETCTSMKNLVRPYCSYTSINYDRHSNKRLLFSDYFEVKSQADSAIFRKVLSAGLSMDNINFIALNDSLDFVVDKQYLFFCFDQYELRNDQRYSDCVGVKRKYLQQFIKRQYQ